MASFRCGGSRGLEQAGEEVGVEVAVLGDQQVLQRGHFLEQAHVLEGAHHALAGDLWPARPWIGWPSSRMVPPLGL
jgi:hypothetical protein